MSFLSENPRLQLQSLLLQSSNPLLPCSASKHSAWPQGDEGARGPSAGAALRGEWRPGAHACLDQGRPELSGVGQWQPGVEGRGPGGRGDLHVHSRQRRRHR